MRIEDFIWLPSVVDTLDTKHNVSPEEVEEVFANRPRVRFSERGRVQGENLYRAYGTTLDGRYLTVFYVYKRNGNALIISARDMDEKERKRDAKDK